MKQIKSILAFAAVAFIGTSVQATDYAITLHVGESSEQKSIGYTSSRWQKLDARYLNNGNVADRTSAAYTREEGSGDKNVAIVHGVNHYEGNEYMSNGKVSSFGFTFEAVGVGTTTWVTYRYGGNQDPPNYAEDAERSGSNSFWANKRNETGGGDTYTITVKDTPKADGVLSIVSTLEKGSALSGVSFDDLEGQMVDSNSIEVKGKYVWKDGAQMLQGGTHGYEATFTPNGEFYDTVDVTIQVVVKDEVEVKSLPEAHTTAKVYTNGVEVTGNPVKVVANATVDVVFTADKGWIFADFSTVKTNTVTAASNPTEVEGESVFEGRSAGEDVYVFSKDGICTIFGTGVATNLPSAFDRGSFTNVVVADGITEIGEAFFWKCRKLNTVTLGKDVETIGENAFLFCLGLEKIEVKNPDIDTKGLEAAISYHAAIKPDGSLYTIPSVSIEGYKEVLYGTVSLTEPDWQPVQAGTPMNASGYHFFKFVLKKIEE